MSVPTDLLARLLTGELPDSGYALLHRPEHPDAGPGGLDVLAGEITEVDSLAELPASPGLGPDHEALVLVPYRQLAERGFAAPDDGAPLLALTVAEQQRLPLATALDRLPDAGIELAGGEFDVDDEAYADIVEHVIRDEIGRGEGANFVIKRTFTADITGYTPAKALTLFRRLLNQETGAYWTFLIHTGERTLVGASPERHVSLHAGTAVMNPISGTYRYPPAGPALPGLLDFLADRKEADELYMVVDEELKMMSRICSGGARVNGPYLKEMARLAHTEYFIEGETDRDPREILHETLFAPTVTGSPLQSAARVIARREPQGRGYYSGIAALIGRDAAGRRTMDSAILIRTADISPGGRVRIGVGATLVRHSDPHGEVAETRAKAAGLLAALTADGNTGFADHSSVRLALEQRNDYLARFWLDTDAARPRPRPELAGRRVLVIDAEDAFTAMIEQQLCALGLEVTVRRYDEAYEIDEYDLVVMGPGPGDPREAADPKIARLRQTVGRLLAERRPFLAVCLSHQVLSRLLGLPLVRRKVPNQGAQRTIDLFGTAERVGFYNTFAARAEADKEDLGDAGVVEISRDAETGEVHALRGAFFASMQFHAESLLTQDGPRITAELLSALPRTAGLISNPC